MNPDPKPGTGALLGHQWEPWQLAKWCYEAGWQDAFFLTTSVQVILAESQGYDHAIHVNLDGSRDRGIWQLNDIHKHITDEIAYDPVRATAEAFKLYAARNGWEDWAAYTSGVFLHDSYLGRAVRGVGNYLGRATMEVPVPDWNGKPYEHSYSPTILNYEHRLAGMREHLEKARNTLGFGAKTEAVVWSTQLELGKALTAAVPNHP